MNSMKVYGSLERGILLGGILGSGGEGDVYALDNMPGLAAKIYHNPIDEDRKAKLLLMLKAGNEKLLNVSAWPVDILYSTPGGPAVGMLMPRVLGFKEIYKLYSPGVRIIEYAHGGWDFLLYTAANLARAFSLIHGYGHIIGDVNPGNILVSNRATVMLIDCDSFQVASGRRYYPCSVGVSIYQPPELQGLKSFKEVIRTRSHDDFGLAVLIFQLLFMGRHPFSGMYTGPGEMPLERAIGERMFIYSKSCEYMKMPPGAPGMNILSAYLASLFERAFLSDNRPEAGDWVRALEELSGNLKLCSDNISHVYFNTLKECPWCRIEKETGALLFSRAAGLYSTGRYLNIDSLWRRIDELSLKHTPLPAPYMKSFKVKPSGDYKRIKVWRRFLAVTFWAGAGFGLACVSGLIDSLIPGIILLMASIVSAICGLRPIPKELIDRAERELCDAKEQLHDCLADWDQELTDEEFLNRKKELSKLVDICRELELVRNEKIKTLQRNRNKQQSESIARLVDKVDQGFISRRNRIMKTLVEKAEDIKRVSKETESRRQCALLNIEEHARNLAAAEANWRVVSRFTYDKSGR